MKSNTVSNALLAALAATALMLSGCASLTTWINSPNGQAEIAAIESIAVPIVENLLIGLIPKAVTPSSPAATPLTIDSPSIVQAQAQAVVQLQAKFPDAPKSVLQVEVNKAFVKALEQKYPTK